MRRSVLSLWFGTAVLTSTLAGGCRQVDRSAVPTPPVGATVSTASAKQPVPRIETVAPLPVARVRPLRPKIGHSPSVPRLPVIASATSRSSRVPPTPTAKVSRSYYVPPNTIRQATGEPVLVTRYPKPLPVLPAATITPVTHQERQYPRQPGDTPYAHQSEYLWLVGVLERGPAVGSWFLRYARPLDNDRFGGRLPLVAPQPIAGYQPGQVLAWRAMWSRTSSRPPTRCSASRCRSPGDRDPGGPFWSAARIAAFSFSVLRESCGKWGDTSPERQRRGGCCLPVACAPGLCPRPFRTSRGEPHFLAWFKPG